MVIKGKINSPPLLSKATLLELGMMQIRPDDSFAKPNDLRVTNKSMKLDVNQVTEKRKTEMTEILDEFGKIRDNKNDSELYVKVNMKPGITPVAQKPRQVRTNIIALIFINFKSANIILNIYSKSLMLKINTTDLIDI